MSQARFNGVATGARFRRVAGTAATVRGEAIAIVARWSVLGRDTAGVSDHGASARKRIKFEPTDKSVDCTDDLPCDATQQESFQTGKSKGEHVARKNVNRQSAYAHKRIRERAARQGVIYYNAVGFLNESGSARKPARNLARHALNRLDAHLGCGVEVRAGRAWVSRADLTGAGAFIKAQIPALGRLVEAECDWRTSTEKIFTFRPRLRPLVERKLYGECGYVAFLSTGRPSDRIPLIQTVVENRPAVLIFRTARSADTRVSDRRARFIEEPIATCASRRLTR